MKTVTLSCVGMFLVTALVSGCSESTVNVPEVSTVSGKVLLSSGKPLTTGRVMLRPAPSLAKATRKARRVIAEIGNDGQFKIDSAGIESPILAGEYKVYIILGNDSRMKSLKKQVPEKYRSMEDDESDLVVNLGEQTDSIVLKLAKS